MIFPVKSHLPLITTHIKFQLKELPPPQITLRQDLGAHLQHQAWHNSVPYGHPRCTSEENPVKNHQQPIRFDLCLMSLLSDMLESGSSSDDDDDAPNTILKPKGEAGRSNSSRYNLKKALGWEEKHYSKFTVSYITLN